MATAVCLSVSAAGAASVTGVELPGSSSFAAPSTNALNYAKQAPGHIGKLAPYVLLNSSGPGSVTLDFFGGYTGLAYFEVRFDGLATGTTAHPVVAGDTIHSPGVGVGANGSTQQSFFANNMVEVRLALGGERGWDFDWTAFHVEPVPLPAALPMLFAGLGGLVLLRRKARKAA